MKKTPRTIARGLGALRSDSGLVVAGWLPWVGAIIVAGVVGGTLGLTGVLGHPTSQRSVYDASLTRAAAAYACPGGAEVTQLTGGDRVVAIARSADSDYLGVRNPLDLAQTVWVHSGLVTVDSNQSPIATLPIQSCPTYSILMPPTSQGDTTPPAAPKPTTKPTTKPTPDTTPPSLGTPTATRNSSDNPVCLNTPFDATRTYAIITVAASDNRGVTAISISWTGPSTDHGSGSMTRSGSSWHFKYDPPATAHSGSTAITIQARDAAGNKSGTKVIKLLQEGCVD